MPRIDGWRIWLAKRILGKSTSDLLKQALDDEILSDIQALRRSIVSSEMDRIDLIYRIRAERQKMYALELIAKGIYDYDAPDSDGQTRAAVQAATAGCKLGD